VALSIGGDGDGLWRDEEALAGLGFGFDFEDEAVAFGAFVLGFEGLVLDGPAVVDAEADGDPVARLGGLNGRCRRFWVGWRSGGIFSGVQLVFLRG